MNRQIFKAIFAAAALATGLSAWAGAVNEAKFSNFA